MHLVSCRHSTSGRTDLRNLATRSMRSRTELMFQVVREKRMGSSAMQESVRLMTQRPTTRNGKKGIVQPGGVE